MSLTISLKALGTYHHAGPRIRLSMTFLSVVLQRSKSHEEALIILVNIPDPAGWSLVPTLHLLRGVCRPTGHFAPPFDPRRPFGQNLSKPTDRKAFQSSRNGEVHLSPGLSPLLGDNCNFLSATL